jgi:hypothetical protein
VDTPLAKRLDKTPARSAKLSVYRSSHHVSGASSIP